MSSEFPESQKEPSIPDLIACASELKDLFLSGDNSCCQSATDCIAIVKLLDILRTDKTWLEQKLSPVCDNTPINSEGSYQETTGIQLLTTLVGELERLYQLGQQELSNNPPALTARLESVLEGLKLIEMPKIATIYQALEMRIIGLRSGVKNLLVTSSPQGSLLAMHSLSMRS